MAGFATLLRFTARRERVRVPVYVLVLVLLIWSTAVQSEALYATAGERADYAATVEGNPGLIAMVGPAYRLTSVGGDVAWQWGGIGAVIAALMSMFVVGRHTRAEEQSGRSELLRSSVVGRNAPTAAALAVAAAVNALVAAAVALAMVGAGQPAAGSIALGASLGAVGLVFAGVAGVAMQVNQSTSGAYGATGAVLGLAYLLRAAGDVGDGTLSWLSPIGWGQAMRPFAGERWWPLLLMLAVTAALVAATFALLSRRDDGAGLFAPRPGPPAAGSPRRSASRCACSGPRSPAGRPGCCSPAPRSGSPPATPRASSATARRSRTCSTRPAAPWSTTTSRSRCCRWR
jgi:ABC-2 type transport system permease protein